MCDKSCRLYLTNYYKHHIGQYNNYLIFILLGTVMTAGAWLTITYTTGKLSAAIIAPIILGQPVITAVLAHYILLDQLDRLQIMGAAAVIIGVLLTQNTRVLSYDEKSK